jgi:hypothetical protein
MGYALGQTGQIGACDLLHRLMDKTTAHVRTKPNPSRNDPTLPEFAMALHEKPGKKQAQDARAAEAPASPVRRI